MCIITRSKRSIPQSKKTKSDDKTGSSNDSFNNFLVKFVEENVPSSIYGMHGCVDEGSAEPTQFSLRVFFSSIGGMSELSYMQKLKCAMVVSDNLYRILYRLIDHQKGKKKTALNDSPLEKIALEFNSSQQKEKLFRLCNVSMPFAFVFDDQDQNVVETIGRMYQVIKLQLENDGGAADTWDVFRRKIRSARKIVQVFVANERMKQPVSTQKRKHNLGKTFIKRWIQLETHLERVLNSRHSPDQIEQLVINYYSDGGMDRVGTKKRKRKASKTTSAKHAKPVEVSVTEQPTTQKKKKKKILQKKNDVKRP